MPFAQGSRGERRIVFRLSLFWLRRTRCTQCDHSFERKACPVISPPVGIVSPVDTYAFIFFFIFLYIVFMQSLFPTCALVDQRAQVLPIRVFL